MEEALVAQLKWAEKKRGEPFPSRAGAALKTGRPIKSTTKRLEQGPPQYIKRAASSTPPVFTAKTRTRSSRTHTLITAHKTQPSFRRRRQFPKTATEGSPKCCFLPPWSAAIPSPNG